MAQLVGLITGMLCATRLVSGLFLWLTKSWDGGVQRLAVVHSASLIAAGLFGGISLAEGGEFAGVQAIGRYLLPQLFWFLFDIYCFRHEKNRLQKISIATAGAIVVLTSAVIFFLAFFSGPNFSNTYSAVLEEIEDVNFQNSSDNINVEMAAILLKGLTIPFVIDEKTIMTEIGANDDSVTIVIEKPYGRLDLFEEEKAYWEAYFCAHRQYSELLSDGAILSFVYVGPKGTKLGGYSIADASCDR